jgi:Flp pilus assembly protein TadB
MAEMKEKSLPLAIGLNLFLPGAGYMYMGKVVVGIAAMLLVLMIYVASFVLGLMTSFGFFVIMTIDMLILGNKRKKEIEKNTTKNCPKCAELIKKEAKVCRFCNTALAG